MRLCAGRGVRGSRPSFVWSRTCRSCQARGSPRSAAPASPARSSSAASCRDRSASRTARASAACARPAPPSSSRALTTTLAPTAAAAAATAREREQLAPKAPEIELAHEPTQLQALPDAEVAQAASGVAEQMGQSRAVLWRQRPPAPADRQTALEDRDPWQGLQTIEL